MVEGSVPRQLGRVKWFDAQKGWGFIQPADGSDDVFVHQESIQAEGFRSLDDGEDVEYETATDTTGRKRAINVSGPGGAPVKGTSRHTGFGGGRGRGGNYGGGQRYGGGNRYEDRGGARDYYQDRQGGGNYQGGYRADYRNDHQGGGYRNEGGFRGEQSGNGGSYNGGGNGGQQYRNDQYRDSYRDQSGYRGGDQGRYQERQQY